MVAIGLTACAVAPVPPTPARWSEPSAACIAEAERFAAEATGRRIRLDEAAFAQRAELVLDEVSPRDAQGRPLDGRRRQPVVETFGLSLRGRACVMAHPASGRSAELPSCRCTPL